MPQAIPAIIVGFKAALAKLTVASVITFAVKTAIVFGVSKLLADRALRKAGGDAGARVQLPPASQNMLPVVYGKAYIKPTIVDAKISTDQKTMWYVCALAEHTDSTAGSSYTFGDIYWNGARCSFSGATVTSTTNNAGQVDTKMNGKIFIYRYPNGSSSGITPGGADAITVMSDSAIPASLRWNSSMYTAGGKSAKMSNTAFLIVQLVYNADADILGLGELTVELTNSITKPGDVIKDYLLNERYGCAVPLANIDTDSLDDLNTYSDQLITFTNTSNVSATQARYRINGPVNTAQPCLPNLQDLVDACDSWIQYSDIEDKWKVVINKPYDVAPNSVSTGSLYHVISDYNDNSNLVGGININPIDLNASYNSVQVAYPDKNVRDQVNYEIFDFTNISSAWYNPGLLSPNEPNNKLDFELPQVNNYIQAAYLGVRRLLQSREDLVISFRTDYSGIQVQAGDVIKITSAEYGWVEKLYRVSQVQEVKDEQANLYAKITAFEYNDTIYADNALTDYVPADNTGLENPNIIGIPNAPTVELVNIGALKYIRVTGIVPTGGITQYFDFNYGTSSDSETHTFYKTVTQSSGNPFTDGTSVTIELNDIPVGTYYWSVTARNDIVGQRGTSSSPIEWLGTDIAPYIELTINNVTSVGNLFSTDAGNAYTGLYPGGNIFIGAGPGTLAPNTYVTDVANSTHFFVSSAPSVALSGTTLLVDLGGINGNTILPNTLPGNTVIPNTLPGNTVIPNTLPGNTIIPGTANGNIIIFGTLNGNVIIANTVNGNTIIANTINGNTIIANTVNGNTIIANTLNGNTVIANTLNGNTITANTLNGNTIIANTVSGNTITANTLNGNTIIANTLNGNTIFANSVNGNVIIANTVDGGVIIGNTIFGNAIIANTLNANAITSLTITSDKIAANAITAGKIDANAVTANTIAANAITAGKIDANAITAGTIAANAVTAGTVAANAITAGTIAANAVTANTIAANAVTAGTIAANAVTAGTIAANAITAGTIAANAITAGTIAANAVTAGTVQANVVTTAILAIGSVSQARSTTAPVAWQNVPFYNWPANAVWPDNTRGIYPVGGVSILPATDPRSSANVEYSEGSRIAVGVTAQLYASANSEYNIIEIWKSGASTVFDRGFNVIKHSYNANANTANITPTVHALGYGSYNLYSDNGGVTWATFPTVESVSEQTFTGGDPTWRGNSNTFPNGFEMLLYGPVQDLARQANIQYFNTGEWLNNAAVVSQSPELNSRASFLFPNVANSANTPVTFTSSCYAPHTNGSGKPFIGAGGINRYSSYITGDTGIIYFNSDGLKGTAGAPLYAEPTGTLQPFYDIFANDTDGGNLYTVCAAGGAGTIVRSIRDFDSYSRNAHPTWSSRSVELANNDPVLTTLYGIAGDGSQHGNGNWVAVGQYGMIQFSSNDGDSWSQVLSPVPDDLYCVRYGNGQWVAAGDSGVILTTSDPGNANAWTQVNIGLTDRDLYRIDYSPDYDTFNIGGQSIILNSNSANINFTVAYSDSPAETYDLTRLTFFGSHPLVSNVALPPEEQRLVNGSVFSTTVIDVEYVQGQETTYFLVVGNMLGAPIQVGQAQILVQELKR